MCIKPLLDEEAAERQKQFLEDQAQQQMAAGMVAPPMMAQPVDMMGNFLPQAILAQYPALAGLDWNTIPQGPPPDEGDFSGRSSFDASSGGEQFYDDLSEGEIPYPDPTQGGMAMGMGMPGQHPGMGMQAGPGAPAYGNIYANQAGDYLSDFEGR